jgi:hypothetical protein
MYYLSDEGLKVHPKGDRVRKHITWKMRAQRHT